VRGPSSSVYGANALFGVINIITKSGRDINGQELALAGSSYRSGAASSVGKKFDNGLNVLLSVSGLTARGPDLIFRNLPGIENTRGITHGTDFEDSYSFFGKASFGDVTFEGGFANRTKGNPGAISAGAFNDPRNYTLDQRAFALICDMWGWWGLRSELTARTYFGEYAYAADYYAVNPIYAPPRLSVMTDVAFGWGVEFFVDCPLPFLAATISIGLESRNSPKQAQVTYSIAPYMPIFSNASESNRSGVSLKASAVSAISESRRRARSDGGTKFRNEISPRFAAGLRRWDTTLLKDPTRTFLSPRQRL